MIKNEAILDQYMNIVATFIRDLTSLNILRITLEFDELNISYEGSDDDEAEKD